MLQRGDGRSVDELLGGKFRMSIGLERQQISRP